MFDKTKKVHAKIKMEVFGEEYWSDEMTYSGTPLDLIKAIQEKLAGVFTSLNKEAK